MKVSDEQGYPPGCTRCAERKAEVERLRAQAAAHRAALLREVREDGLAGAAADGWDFGREDTLAEVRHVIEELMGGERNALVSGDYILSRLEEL